MKSAPSASKITFAQTLDAMRQDLRRYSADAPLFVVLVKSTYAHPALAGILYYRIGHWLWALRRNPLAWLPLVCYLVFYPLVRMYSGLELWPFTSVGPGFQVLHFGPTVIHPAAVIGSNVTMLHGVTLGVAIIGISNIGAPRIGNNVAIGTGASIIGDITIGDNATIGAHAVVTSSVPEHTTVTGIPARPVMSAANKRLEPGTAVAKAQHDERRDSAEVAVPVHAERSVRNSRGLER